MTADPAASHRRVIATPGRLGRTRRGGRTAGVPGPLAASVRRDQPDRLGACSAPQRCIAANVDAYQSTPRTYLNIIKLLNIKNEVIHEELKLLRTIALSFMKNSKLLRTIALVLAFTAPGAAFAYQASDWLVKLRLANVDPNDDSGTVFLGGRPIPGSGSRWTMPRRWTSVSHAC
ncbi:MAG: hypothetical protein OEQ18_17965 [Gammaproteobacteria bacterium]|nr:hypothetical protein [Gammaproteobacteria bacterium]